MKTLTEMGAAFVAHSGVNCTADRHWERAEEEMGELQEVTFALADGWPSEERVAEEAADVILTLAALCAQYGLDLDAAIARKHGINMRRKWIKHPTIPGAVKGIKLPEETK